MKKSIGRQAYEISKAVPEKIFEWIYLPTGNSSAEVHTGSENSVFEYEFYAQTVSLVGRAENLRLKVEIDNKIMTAGFYVRKSSANQVFWHKSGLSSEHHHMKVTVLSGELWLMGIVTDFFGNPVKLSALLTQKKSDNYKNKLYGRYEKNAFLFTAGLAVAVGGMYLLKNFLKNN